MLGERYFASRERLAEVVKGIRTLALETGTDPGPLEDEVSFLARLYQPVLFLVCGEVNAGKSTFINGLVGRPLCPAGVLPETKSVLRYQYGDRNRNLSRPDGRRFCLRNEPLLRDFNFVDTPGTNGAWEMHREEVEEVLEEADLVFFVFPVSNPWGSATWTRRPSPACCRRRSWAWRAARTSTCSRRS